MYSLQLNSTLLYSTAFTVNEQNTAEQHTTVQYSWDNKRISTIFNNHLFLGFAFIYF